MKRGRKPVLERAITGCGERPARAGALASRPACALIALVLAAASAVPAAAQMMLPGANNGNVIGAPPKTTGLGGNGGGAAPAPAPMRPIAIKPPGVDTILGRTLSRDGHQGVMVFGDTGGGLLLTKLRFSGEKISRPQQSCTVDVPLVAGLRATPGGEPDGALRYDVPLDACAFTMDVLDGAVLVTRPDTTCEFKQADCRVSPGGVWGPAAAEITPARAKELERERVRIETTMRTNFRALLKKAGKDKAAVKAIARDQAAFSSEREMTCRDYDQEAVHGFCSTQITQARALALLARYGTVERPEPSRAAAKARPRAKKPPVPRVTPATAPAAPLAAPAPAGR